MGYYNVEDYVRQKKQYAKEISVPPRANLMVAANHLRSIFEAKKLAYGFMGGFEMLCLGYRREMASLQIAYNEKDFHRIRAKLEADPRVRLPEGINSLFPARLLVRTGPAFKDKECTHSGDIEVDIIPPGSHGTPPAGELANNIVLLSLKTDGKLRTYKGLNMLHLVKSLVVSCGVPDLAWDPREDILFLCQHYGEQVESIRLQLDPRTIKQNFLGTPFFFRLSSDDQRRCYQVLLGMAPPPTMSFTPPVPLSHKHLASAPSISKSHNKAQTSSSSLSSNGSSELSGPPILAKPKSSQTGLESSEPGRPNPQTKSPDFAKRESRLRYRNASTTNSQEVSPIDGHITAKHSRQHSQPPLIGNQMSSNTLSHNASRSLQLPLQLAVNSTTQSTRSMPNLHAGLSGPAPPYAFSHIPPSMAFGRLPQLTHGHVFPVEMAASPVLSSATPIQPRAKKAPDVPQHQPKDDVSMLSRPRPSRNNLSRETTVNEILITDRPRPPRAKSHEQVPPRAELSATPVTENRERELRVVNPDMTVQSQDTYLTTDQKLPSPVELDAMYELKQFIAELSVERSTPAPELTDSNVAEYLAEYKSTLHSTLVTSALAKQASLPNRRVLPNSHHEDIPIQPLKTRTTASSIGALPTSLRPGGTASHCRTMSIGSGDMPTADTIPVITNASKYTNLAAPSTPPPSLPNSPQPTYVAYNPTSAPVLPNFIMPLSPPASTASADQAESPNSSNSPDSPERQSRFSRLADVDGAGGYFKDKHRRDKSADTRALAMEYQAELPVFGEGYWKISLDFESDRRVREQDEYMGSR